MNERLLSFEEFVEQYWEPTTPPTRWQEGVIREALAARNAIVIAGVRQGKTTLCMALTRMFNEADD